MKKHAQFHGSDLEEIEKIYHIPKEEIVCFGANVNPLGLSAQVKNNFPSTLISSPLTLTGSTVLFDQAIGQYCDIDPNYIVVGNGSTELISLLIQHRTPKSALLLGPTYSEYERELSLCGGKLSYYTLSAAKDFQLDCNQIFVKISIILLIC